jgi:hypothetical protein
MGFVGVLDMASAAARGLFPLYRRCDFAFLWVNALLLVLAYLTSLNSYRLALDQRVVELEYQLISLVIHVKE